MRNDERMKGDSRGDQGRTNVYDSKKGDDGRLDKLHLQM